MWNLPAPSEEDVRNHLDIAFPIGVNPQGVSEAEKDEVLEFYAAYRLASGRASADLAGEGTRPGLRQAIHDAYALVQENRRLGGLRAALKLSANLCPYCGYGPVEELDHVLQRAHFKLFSIFVLNMVPCCGTCNRGKRRVPDYAAYAHQLHTYLEDVSEFEFFHASAEIDPETGGLAVRFRIAPCSGMSDELFNRLANHLHEFDLQTRYVNQVNILLGELEYAITTSYEERGPQGLTAFLAGTAVAHAKRFGQNDWRTAVMRALSECEAFCAGGFRVALGYPEAD